MGKRKTKISDENEALKWQVLLTPTTLKMLESISDERVRQKIIERIDGLTDAPEKQGKALIGDLKSYRSMRAVGQRYRILYRLDGTKIIVIVVAIGLRRDGDKADVYQLAKKLLKLGLLSPD